jgi:hypothetical protein
MSWIVDHWYDLGTVAGKAVLMYATAVVGLRLGERRTLAQWTIIDFATAVAIGAIVGRTAIAGTQSYATGAVALLTLIAVHRLAACCGFARWPASCSITESGCSSTTASCAAASCGYADSPTTISTPSCANEECSTSPGCAMSSTRPKAISPWYPTETISAVSHRWFRPVSTAPTANSYRSWVS